MEVGEDVGIAAAWLRAHTRQRLAAQHSLQSARTHVEIRLPMVCPSRSKIKVPALAILVFRS